MAIAYDAVSSSSAGTSSLSWTHTPTGTPKGVWVYVLQYLTLGDEVTGVTYGGVSMTETTDSPYLVNQTEKYAIYSYFLGSSVPTGAQTVVVSVDATGSTKQAGAITVTAAADTAVNDTIQYGNTASDATTATLLLSSASSFCALAFMSSSNLSTSTSPITGWTDRFETDFGSEVGGAYTYDTVGTSDVVFSITAGTSFRDAIAIAIKESAASGITGTGALSTSATTASGAGSIAHTGTGALTVSSVTVNGSGVLSHTGTGAISVMPITASGAGTLAHTGTGAIIIGTTTLSGSGSIGAIITGTGALTISSITIDGIGVRIGWDIAADADGSWSAVAASDGSWSDIADSADSWAAQTVAAGSWSVIEKAYVDDLYVDDGYVGIYVGNLWITQNGAVDTWQ